MANPNLTKMFKRGINPFSVLNITKQLKNKHIRHSSTEVAVKTEEDRKLIKDVEKIKRVSSKEIAKKPQKPPFAKNLFVGIFDTDILTYPEVLDKSDIENLEKDVQPVGEFFQDLHEGAERKITKHYMEDLSRLNLIGLRASSLVGGRQLSVTETCRYNEVISQHTSRASITEHEQLGVQVLLKKGNELQRGKYLDRVMNGESIMAFCVSELETSEPRFLKASAVLSSDKKKWILNGEKTWTVNGDTADLFVVLATTGTKTENGITENKTTAFLVERNFGGVSSKPCNFVGLDSTDISDVTFENTSVPLENVIGEVNSGEQVISSLLTEFRLSRGPVCSALLRKLINKFTEECIEANSSKVNITETEIIQSKIGEMIISLYAVESMTYLTAALIDQYENQDCELESTIVKIFSEEQCFSSALKCMDFLGIKSVMKDNWCYKLYRDALGHRNLHEAVDSLRIIAALLGLQHAGVIWNEKIRFIRNPLFYPGFILKRMWTEQRHINDNPKLRLQLQDYLHPSAMAAAKFLEYSVLRLEYAAEVLLARHGPDVLGKHVELERLANTVIDVYAMTAVLGRASRSYCIGVQHAAHEMHMATAFCTTAMERVKFNVNKIAVGPYNTVDELYFKIGREGIRSKGYFPQSPLTRTF